LATTDPVGEARTIRLDDRQRSFFVELHTDLVFRQFDGGRLFPGGRQLHYDFLQPLAETPTPLVVFIKGGAFRNVHRSRFVPALMSLAERGIAVASVEYRTSNECRFPGQLHDVKAAVRYFRAHAAELNIDPAAIAAWGNSAGGTLATILGATNGVAEYEGNGEHREHSSSVCAVADWYGLVDAKAFGDSADPDSPVRALLGPPGGPDDLWFSPSTFLGPATPPMLIVHGDRDTVVPPEQSQILARGLSARGLRFEYYSVEGAGHSFSQLCMRSDALEITRCFLERWLSTSLVIGRTHP
jgi:acetyl esterase/lipase